MIGAFGCAVRRGPDTADFLSQALQNPKKIGVVEVQSRYWKHGNLLVHFLTNASDKNRSLTPMIYVHGLGGSVDGFLELIRVLHGPANARPYYAIDLPPFGRSAMQKGELTIHGYAEMLKDFVMGLPSPKVNLVCHSMGGQVCIDFALANPQKVELLTLISPAGIYDKSAFVNGATRHFVGISVGPVHHPGASTIGDMSWYNQDFQKRMITNDPLMLIAVESFRENFHDRIQNLRTRTLILWGREDRIFDFENGLYLRENVEDSTLYVIEGAAHTPMTTHAELLSKLIMKHL